MAISSARRMGLCNGTRLTAVPILILVVVWAMAAAASKGDGITENLGLKCNSASHTESNPNRSPNWAAAIMSE